jgi:endoglucanase
LQESDGSVLSIIGETGASPPSASTAPCRYGPATTAATFATAAAFATAARVLPKLDKAELTSTATDALSRAEQAWDWGASHLQVTFRNNEGASAGLGAGQQEPDDYGRLVHQIDAAGQLFSATGQAEYKTFFDSKYTELHLFTAGNSVEPWHILGQDAALDYMNAEGATPATVDAIKTSYLTGIKSGANLGAIPGDPYSSPIPAYTWGTNAIKSHMGNNFLNVVHFGMDPASDAQMTQAAAGYVHYVHGLNALSLVFLTNMYDYGAENCANEIYHDWFRDGSALWDRVGVSTYGPPPGFVPGGPNPYYECGDTSAACDPAKLTPPLNQPAQKSYKDFNAAWPEGSWSISEPSNGYQVAYIRMLSKFVR